MLIYFAAIVVFASDDSDRHVFSSDAFGIVLVLVLLSSTVVGIWAILVDNFGQNAVTKTVERLRTSFLGVARQAYKFFLHLWQSMRWSSADASSYTEDTKMDV